MNPATNLVFRWPLFVWKHKYRCHPRLAGPASAGDDFPPPAGVERAFEPGRHVLDGSRFELHSRLSSGLVRLLMSRGGLRGLAYLARPHAFGCYLPGCEAPRDRGSSALHGPPAPRESAAGFVLSPHLVPALVLHGPFGRCPPTVCCLCCVAGVASSHASHSPRGRSIAGSLASHVSQVMSSSICRIWASRQASSSRSARQTTSAARRS